MQSELPPILPSEVKTRLLRELFLRTRESSVAGLLAVALLAWLHLGRQPELQLWLWTLGMVALLCYRWLLANAYVTNKGLQGQRYRRWHLLEWLGNIGLAIGWACSLGVLGGAQVDTFFFLRLIFVVVIMTFLLSSIGIEFWIYSTFLATLTTTSLFILHRVHPDFLPQLSIALIGFVVYVSMLLLRSRGEHLRTQDWIRARLTQNLLLDDLRRTIEQQRQTEERLRLQSIELENSNRRLKELAIHDGLTRVFRRGHIETELLRLIKAEERHPSHLCVLLLDLDHFKQINDRYGHAAGDEVLRNMAAHTQTLLRGSDLLGRWGGEEFIIILPDTTLEQAVEAAQRIRESIAQLGTPIATGQVRVTLSIGVAELASGEPMDSLLRRVDQALYAAKDSGRNQVVTANPPA